MTAAEARKMASSTKDGNEDNRLSLSVLDRGGRGHDDRPTSPVYSQRLRLAIVDRPSPTPKRSQRLRSAIEECETGAMSNERQSTRRSGAYEAEAEAVLAACRVLVAVSARSIAAVEDI